VTSSATPIRFLVYPSLGDVREPVRAELLGLALSRRMGRPVQVEMTSSYETLAREIAENRVDIAWATAEQCALFGPKERAVLRAVRFGRGYYHAALVCRANEALTLERLRGRRAAWVSPHSLGGYLLVTRHLEALGHPPATLFSEERFFGTYRRAMQAVISGEADVTSVLSSQPDETTARAFMSSHLESDERWLKPFLFTGATPADGLIITRRLSEAEAASVVSIILELSKGGTGLEQMISPFHTEGFVLSPDESQPPPASWTLRGANFLALTLDEQDRCRSIWSPAGRALGRDVCGNEGRLLAEVLGAEAADRLLPLVRLTRLNRAGGRVTYHLEEAGKSRWYAAEVTLCSSGSGQQQPDVVLQLRDITDYYPLEDHLYRLASFPLLHPAPMMELDREGELRYANPAAHELFPDLSARGRSHPVVEAAFAWARSGEAGLPPTVHWEGRYWELAVVLLQDAELLRVFAQDVTARKQMEHKEAKWAQELRAKNDELASALSQLRDAQNRLILQDRLAALGTLTAGIAHELRNPLNFVNSFSGLSEALSREMADELTSLGDKLGPEHLPSLQQSLADLTASISKVKEHGGRMERIIRSMLEHSRGGKGERRRILLNLLLTDSIDLVSNSMRSRYPSFSTKIEQEFDTSVGAVEVVPQEISRVIVNLLENACYAVNVKKRMQGGGNFQGRIQVKTLRLGHSVEIHIRDNGMGIPKNVRDKLFTPFFTTKPAGEGTGLGLSISHEIIVKGYGGTLRFESEEGAFTEFIITLPSQQS
jgi:two-component system NtrC family sensor kinase